MKKSQSQVGARRKAGVPGGSFVPCAKILWSKAGVGVAGYVQLILILFAGHPHTVFAGSGGGLR
jgi:hypothetical protein